MPKNIADHLNTDTAYISQLVADIKKGEVKIPQFQRKFVWKEEQALKLLDSIANSYPIGSILLWKTHDKLNAERTIGNFKLPETDEMTPTNYVLDGQQRLTVIYSCIGANEDEQGFATGYDLMNEEFVELKEPSNPTVFPLRKLLNTTSLLNYRTGLLTQPDPQLLQDRLDQLISSFSQYKLPVVTLKNLSIDEVCPIFERINSSGTRLATYDLMVAATWNEGFDLNCRIDEILSALEIKGFGNTSRSTILKCLSGIKLGSIKDKSLKTLRELPTIEIEQAVETTKEAVKRSVDLLSTSFGIQSWDFLSYEAILVIITKICQNRKELSADEASRLRKWFWESSFGERYKVGGEAFVSNDLETVSAFVFGFPSPSGGFGKIPQPSDWGQISFRSNVSRSRAFLLALASRDPLNLSNGVAVDTNHALSAYNKKEYHHFYPRAYLKSVGKSKFANVLGNIVMITANTNKAISAKPPKIYVPELIDNLGPNRAEAVFKSNLLPLPSEFDYTTATYEDFLIARGHILNRFCLRLASV